MGKNTNSKSLYDTPEGETEVMATYENILKAWQLPHKSFFVSTRQGETFILSSGNPASPPLILFHGTDSNSLFWLEDIAQYSKKFCVYAPDNLGEPGKSAPSRPDWNSPSYLEWIEDILESLHIQNTSLLGLSQGGWLALKFATSHPERVNKLVLFSPAGIGPLRKSFGLRLFPWMLPKIRNPHRVLKLVFGDLPIPADVSRFSKPMIQHFKSRKRNMPDFSDAELQRLKMPVLLAVSPKDAIFKANVVRARLKSLLGENMKVVFLPHGGHSLYGLTDITVPFLSNSNTAE